MKAFKLSMLAVLVGLSSNAYAKETVAEDFSRFGVGDPATTSGMTAADVTEVVSDEKANDEDKQSWKITFPAGSTGFTNLGAPTVWNWSEDKTVKLDILNTTGAELKLSITLYDNSIPGQYWNGKQLQQEIVVPAGNDFQTLEVDLSLASTDFDKSIVKVLQVKPVTASTSDSTIYIDNIRADDGKAEEPVVEEPIVEEGATVAESFERFTVGNEAGSFGSAANTTAIVSDEKATDEDGQSWKLTYAAEDKQYANLGAPTTWNWSTEGTLKLDVLNTSDEALNLTVTLYNSFTNPETNQSEWWKGATSEYEVTVAVSDKFQSIEIDLDAGTLDGDFTKADVKVLQIKPTETLTVESTVYVDNIRTFKSDEEPGEPSEFVSEVVESFADDAVGTIVDTDEHVPNIVSADFASDDDTKSLKLTYTEAYKGAGVYQDRVKKTPGWDWSEFDTFNFDISNDNDQELTFNIRFVGASWNADDWAHKIVKVPSSKDAQSIKIDFSTLDAGKTFDRSKLIGIQFMLSEIPTGTAEVYIDNLHVTSGTKDGEEPVTPEPTPEPTPKNPEYQDAGGSLGSFGLMLLSAMALFRRRK